MSLETIKEEELPPEVREQLLKNEKVHYFSYITYKGGCSSSSNREDYWIALSNKRVLYKAKVMEDNNTRVVEKEGILPIEKISFIEVTDVSQRSGCSDTKINELRISSSGGTVNIPIPNKEKGYEVRKAFIELTEHLKEHEQKKHKYTK